MHGGKTPSGLASPHTRTGRYSKHLPTRMLARYQDALGDPELLSVHEDVALLQAEIGQRLAQIQASQAMPPVTEIITRVERLQASWQSWEWTRVELELEALREAVSACQTEQRAMREVRKLLKEKATLIAQESRRLVELEQSMTVEEALLLAQGLVGIVRRHVADLPNGNDRLRAIAGEFREVFSAPEKVGRA